MIVNADDFGYSGQINAAILESFERGYCSSATIMANMPGFKEACGLVREKKLNEHVGVHFVITEGTSLTRGIRTCPRLSDRDGAFVLRRDRRVFRLTSREKEALAEELKAQVARCRRHGVRITHADSHKHIHEEWAIASVAMRVCREEGIPYLRLARNCGRMRTRANRVYRNSLNLRLRHAGLARTRYFGSVSDYEYLVARKGTTEPTRSIEVMIHPAYDSRGVLIDAPTGRTLEECAQVLDGKDSAISFAGRQYRGCATSVESR